MIMAIIVGIVVGITKFAPTIGSLFGFFSIHRNEKTEFISATLTPPIFVDPPEAAKEKKVTLKGIAEPASTVKLYVNGPEKASTVADLVGEFTFVDVELNEGTNTIFARSEFNNETSEKSETIKISVDKDSPKITIKSPENGATIKNLDRRILIEGEVSEDVDMTINDRVVVVKPDHTFSFLLGVDEGNVEIKIKAVDKADNETEETLNVKYERRSY